MRACKLLCGEVPEEILTSGAVTMPVMIMTAHYYLDDVDEELGPTKFIPNSHMAGRRPKKGEDTFHGVGAKSILARKGDCVRASRCCLLLATCLPYCCILPPPAGIAELGVCACSLVSLPVHAESLPQGLSADC